MHKTLERLCSCKVEAMNYFKFSGMRYSDLNGMHSLKEFKSTNYTEQYP